MDVDRKQNMVYKLGLGMRRETWLNFRIDFSASVLFSLFNVVIGQFYIPMSIRHGASNFEVGLLSAAPAIGSLLSPIWAGLIGSKSPKPFVMWPSLIGRLSVFVVAAWLSPLIFVIVAFFINLTAGIQAPAYPALVTRIYPGQLCGRLMGYVRMAQGFFLIPLAYLVGRWIDANGDAKPLMLASICGSLSVVVFWFVREVEPIPKTQDQPIHNSLRAQFRVQWEMVKQNQALVVFLLATSAAGFGNMLAGPLYQIYQIHQLNLNNVQIGVTRMVYYALLLVAYFAMGWIIDKRSPRHALLIGIAANILAPLFYVVLGSYGAAIATSGLQGIGDATWDIGVMTYVFKLAPGREAAVFGIHLLLFGIRGSSAPLLGTALTHVVPISTIFLAASAFCLIGFVLLYRAKPNTGDTTVALQPL